MEGNSYIKSLTEKEPRHSIFCYISKNFKSQPLVDTVLKNYSSSLAFFYQEHPTLIHSLSELSFTTKLVKKELKYSYARKADLIILFHSDSDKEFLSLARYCYDKTKTVILVPCENEGYNNIIYRTEDLL